MERDPHIAKLVKEGGILPAPEGLEDRIMDLVNAEPLKQAYKPLIGRKGRIGIILFMLGIILLSILLADTGNGQGTISAFFQEQGWEFPQLNLLLEQLKEMGWQLPEVKINLDFFSRLIPSSGIAAGIIALFILVLSDAGLQRRRLT
jgi:hypothetical protein